MNKQPVKTIYWALILLAQLNFYKHSIEKLHLVSVLVSKCFVNLFIYKGSFRFNNERDIFETFIKQISTHCFPVQKRDNTKEVYIKPKRLVVET